MSNSNVSFAMVDTYGRPFKAANVPHFDKKAFLESNATTLVFATPDELHDLLVLDGYSNVQNDVALLLNSRRLECEDPKAVADMVRKRFAERSTISPFEGMSDNEIFANIKSRHIQSLGELDRYAENIAGMLYPSTLSPEIPSIEEKVEPTSE